MANISINGAHYTDVPRIDVPNTSGVGNSSFYDTSGDTATAEDVLSGKTFHGANGPEVGEASGGSSSSLQPSKSATAQEASVTVTPDTGYDAMEQVVVAPDNMALMASKASADVSGPGSAVLLDMENSFAGSFFYGFNGYFRNNIEDSDISTSDFPAPKYWKIKLPKTMTALGGRAFMGVAGLCEVDANPDNGVIINARAFYGCRNLQTLGGLWAKITTINGNGIRPLRQGDGSGSLLERSKDISAPMLTTVPSGSDGAYALSRCAFKSFTAPLLQRVGNNMFAYCYYLQTLDFTAVTTIEAQAFRGCTSLTDIYLRNTSGVVTLQNTNAFSTPYQVTVHVPSSLVSDYLNDTNWSASGVTITSI